MCIRDRPKLFAGNYKKIDEHTVEITVQKTQEQAVIYLFPVAKEILNKYSPVSYTHLAPISHPQQSLHVHARQYQVISYS